MITTDRPDAPKRRRGSRLEGALLQAAWDELAVTGYAGFTMEGVAARAGTGKAVLYRRWHNRAELVVATLRSRMGPLVDNVPDTGSLRADTLAVLRQARTRQDALGVDAIHGLLMELADLPKEMFTVGPAVMLAVLKRAVARGEAKPARLTPLIAAVPVILLRHEMLISPARIPDEFLEAVVDEIFLPLVHS